MDQATIDRPADVADEIVDRAEITAGNVLVQYSRTEAALAELRARLAGKTFDLTTTAGDKAARAARLELVTLRTGLEKKRKEFKAPALEFGKRVDSEAARITSEIKAIEDPIDAQIVADERRRAAEKAERERIEAERVAEIRGRLDKIRAAVAKCHGITSERIANGITQVDAIAIENGNWAEFEDEARQAKSETLEAMRALFASAAAAEAAAAAAEAQRREQARIAEEQRAEAARLQAEADALAEQKRRDDEAAAARLAELERREREIAEQRAAFERQQAEAARKAAEPPSPEPVADANPGPAGDLPVVVEAQAAETAIDAPAADPVDAPGSTLRGFFGPVDLIAPDPEPVAVSAAPAVVEVPTLKLGDINARLAPAVSTSADGLASLGFAAIPGKGVAKLYRESDWPAIKAAIVAHINSLT